MEGEKILEPMEKVLAIKKSALFEEIPLEDITRFIGILDEKVFPCGHTISHEGDRGDVMYIILSGEVLIQKKISDGVEMKITLGPNECFGEMAILDGFPRSARVTVIREGTLLSISRDEFRDMLRVYPELIFKVISILSGRLRNLGTNLAKTISEEL